MRPKLLLFCFALLSSACSFAQEIVPASVELSPDVTANYHVLKSDNKTLEGLFQAFYKKKTAIASGTYDHGKRTGVWHFFDQKSKLLQHFDYQHYALTYEAPDDSASNFKYILDAEFTKTDTVTKPIRVGGRYFGYLPYLNLFRLPKDMIVTDPTVSWPSVYIELLVSPAGRLADYRVHIFSGVYGERVLAVNINQLSDDDKLFVPATVNGKDVMSRIVVKCNLTGSRRLTLF